MQCQSRELEGNRERASDRHYASIDSEQVENRVTRTEMGKTITKRDAWYEHGFEKRDSTSGGKTAMLEAGRKMGCFRKSEELAVRG